MNRKYIHRLLYYIILHEQYHKQHHNKQHHNKQHTKQMSSLIQHDLTYLFLKHPDVDEFKTVMLQTYNVRISSYEAPESKQSVHSAVYNDDTNYNSIARQCRGIFFVIEDSQVRLIAQPFKKFFNYVEHNSRFPKEFERIVAQISGPVQAFEKLDGDIIKLYYYEGRWYFGTNNVPFKKPSEIDTFFEQNDIKFDDFCSNLDKNCTYIFELTAPMKHVTFYEHVSLTLIGIIHTQTGEESDIRTYGTSFHGIPVVRCIEFPTIADANDDANDENKLPSHPAFEGYVVRLELPGIHGEPVRFKIKNEGYFRRQSLSAQNVTYASLLARLVTVAGTETKLGSPKQKDLDDYNEVQLYIPKIAGDVNRTYESIMSEIKQLVESLPSIRHLTGKDRHNALSGYKIVRKIASRLISNQNVTVEVALQTLMNENKSEMYLKNMLKRNMSF